MVLYLPLGCQPSASLKPSDSQCVVRIHWETPRGGGTLSTLATLEGRVCDHYEECIGHIAVPGLSRIVLPRCWRALTREEKTDGHAALDPMGGARGGLPVGKLGAVPDPAPTRTTTAAHRTARNPTGRAKPRTAHRRRTAGSQRSGGHPSECSATLSRRIRPLFPDGGCWPGTDTTRADRGRRETRTDDRHGDL